MASSLLQQLSLLGGIPSFTPDSTDPTPPPTFQWNKWKIGLVAVASVPVIASVALAIFATITLQWHIAAGALGVAGIILTGTWILIGRPTLDEMVGSSTPPTPEEQLPLLRDQNNSRNGSTSSMNPSGNALSLNSNPATSTPIQQGTDVRLVDSNPTTTNTLQKTTSFFSHFFTTNSHEPIPSLENEDGHITAENVKVAIEWSLKNKNQDFDDDESDKFDSLVSQIQKVITGPHSDIIAQHIGRELTQEFCEEFPIEIDLTATQQILDDVLEKLESSKRECLTHFEDAITAASTAAPSINKFSEHAGHIISHDALFYVDSSIELFGKAIGTLVSLWDRCVPPQESTPLDKIAHYRQKFDAASEFTQLIDMKISTTHNPKIQAYLAEIRDTFKVKQLEFLNEWVQFSQERLDLRPSYQLKIGDKTVSAADLPKEIEVLSRQVSDLQTESMFATNYHLVANTELDLLKSQLLEKIQNQKANSLDTTALEQLLTKITHYQTNPTETALSSIVSSLAMIRENTENHIDLLAPDLPNIQAQQEQLRAKIESSTQLIAQIDQFFSPNAHSRTTWDTKEILSDIILLLEEANKAESGPRAEANNRMIKLIQQKMLNNSFESSDLETALKKLKSEHEITRKQLLESDLQASSQKEQACLSQNKSLRELSELTSILSRSVATISSETLKKSELDRNVENLTSQISSLKRTKQRQEREHLLDTTTPGNTTESAHKWQNYLEAFVNNLRHHNIPLTSWTQIILTDIRSKYDESLFTPEFETELLQNIINTLPEECKPIQLPNESTSSSSTSNHTPGNEKEFELMHDAIVEGKLPLLDAMSSTSHILPSISSSSGDFAKEKTVFEILNKQPLSGVAQREAKIQNSKILAFINENYTNYPGDKTPIEQTIISILFLFAADSTKALSKDQIPALVEELKAGRIAFPNPKGQNDSFRLVQAPIKAKKPEQTAIGGNEKSIIYNLMGYINNDKAKQAYFARWRASHK